MRLFRIHSVIFIFFVYQTLATLWLNRAVEFDTISNFLIAHQMVWVVQASYVNKSINEFMYGFLDVEGRLWFCKSMHCIIRWMRCPFCPKLKSIACLKSVKLYNSLSTWKTETLIFFFVCFFCIWLVWNSYTLQNLFGHIFNLD